MRQESHDALAYASALHATRVRKSTAIPYISHWLAVTSIVLEAGVDETEAIAAVLHDAVEDQGGPATLDKIRRRDGGTFAEIVAACSDTDVVPKPPWRERKRAYLEHLRTVDASVLLVSAADKLHNARATLRDLEAEGHSEWGRFSASASYTLENYRGLTESTRSPTTNASYRSLSNSARRSAHSNCILSRLRVS